MNTHSISTNGAVSAPSKTSFPYGKRTHVKPILFAGIFLVLFGVLTVFLFRYHGDEKRFTSLTNDLFLSEMKANTLNMHYTLANPSRYGIHDYKPVLSCFDPDDIANGQLALEHTISDLRSIRVEKLSETDANLMTLLSRSLENAKELNEYTYYSEPLSPSSGMQSQLPILLAEYTFRSKRDVEDYLCLLDQTDEYFASLLVFEQEKAAAGLIMPAAFLKEVREQCDTIVTKEILDTGTHFMQTTFRERVQKLYDDGLLTVTDVQNYLSEHDRLLKTVLLPAYTALGDGLILLEDASVVPAGLASYPEGKTYYEQLLISETGSYRPIPEIQEMLTTQFTKEYDAMAAIITEHPEVMTLYNDSSSSPFPFQEAAHMLLDLQTRMKEDFPALPGGTTEVALKSVSENLEDYCAPAFYLTPPLDDTDTNTIYINKTKTPEGLSLYTTLAHEGYPGHLYQNVYFNRSCLENEERPARQLLWYGGYTEGWAMYVEMLAYDYATELLAEYGKVTTIPSSSGAVSSVNNSSAQESAYAAAAHLAQLEKHNRSLQLCLYSLLDIMIHYEGASYNQIAKVLEGFGITNATSAKAIYNYIVQEPCNYLKYYLGYLEILALQENAREVWGDDYSDLRFHQFFLDCGPSDFTTLQERLHST